MAQTMTHTAEGAFTGELTRPGHQAYQLLHFLFVVGKGCAAGMAGGLLASFVMTTVNSAVQRVVSAPPPQGEDSTVKTATALSRSVLHKDLTPRQKQTAGPIVHYTFGTSVAAAYGAAAEFAPAACAGYGTVFGLAVWLGAHVLTVPALGLSEPITSSSPRKEAPELAAHIAYGLVVEAVRRSVRGVRTRLAI